MRRSALRLAGVSGMLAAAGASAGPADVVAARAECRERICRFVVTVRHADVDWGHFANRFQVLAPDGTVLGTRVLRHPHATEQPFTRSLESVRLPEDVSRVTIRARDSLHGWGGAEMEIDLAALVAPEDAPEDSPEAAPEAESAAD